MKSRTSILLATAAIVLTGAAGLAHIAHSDDGRGGWRQAHGSYEGHGEGRRGKHYRKWRGKYYGKRSGRRRGMRMEGMLERFDTDKDGKLTQAEIDAAQAERIAEFDTDNDGNLSLGEFEALWLDGRRERMVRDFQRLDRDGDATVTVEEFTKRTARMVERIDRNGDGAISREDRGGKRRGWRNRYNVPAEKAPEPANGTKPAQPEQP